MSERVDEKLQMYEFTVGELKNWETNDANLFPASVDTRYQYIKGGDVFLLPQTKGGRWRV